MSIKREQTYRRHTILNKNQSLESIKHHLAEQFNLPMEQIDMLLPSFIATLGTHMGNLENALANNNQELLGKAGHTIKGAFLNLGLNDCAQIALIIEEKGRQGGSLADFKKLVDDLRFLVRPVLE
ncbi:MAG: Hpt domain-containing protein [Pseudomonadota bacterium]